MPVPKLSVVIPVYNEEAVLPALFARLYPALDALGASYEVIFINDGSVDRSAALLREQFQRRPDATRVILFGGNYGQHMAIVAGVEHSRGERGVTADADPPRPPAGAAAPGSGRPIGAACGAPTAAPQSPQNTDAARSTPLSPRSPIPSP